MVDRRRYQRFVLCEPPEATLTLSEDVAVAVYRAAEIFVLSRTEARCNDAFVLTLSAPAMPDVTMKVRMIESRPTVIDGAVRYFLRMAVQRPEGDKRQAGLHED